MVSKLIALNSPLPQSGKSTLARALIHKQGFRVMPFAAPVKRMVVFLLEQLGYDAAVASHLVSQDKEHQVELLDGVTVRHLLQTIGTDWGRQMIHPEIWVRAWRPEVEQLLMEGVSVVVDDMRFPNELAEVKRLGGLTVRVVRPAAIRGPESAHVSEGQLDTAEMDVTLQVPEQTPTTLAIYAAREADKLARRAAGDPPESAATGGPHPSRAELESFYVSWWERNYGLGTRPGDISLQLLAAAVRHFSKWP